MDTYNKYVIFSVKYSVTFVPEMNMQKCKKIRYEKGKHKGK